MTKCDKQMKYKHKQITIGKANNQMDCHVALFVSHSTPCNDGTSLNSKHQTNMDCFVPRSDDRALNKINNR